MKICIPDYMKDVYDDIYGEPYILSSTIKTDGLNITTDEGKCLYAMLKNEDNGGV